MQEGRVKKKGKSEKTPKELGKSGNWEQHLNFAFLIDIKSLMNAPKTFNKLNFFNWKISLQLQVFFLAGSAMRQTIYFRAHQFRAKLRKGQFCWTSRHRFSGISKLIPELKFELIGFPTLGPAIHQCWFMMEHAISPNSIKLAVIACISASWLFLWFGNKNRGEGW